MMYLRLKKEVLIKDANQINYADQTKVSNQLYRTNMYIYLIKLIYQIIIFN